MAMSTMAVEIDKIKERELDALMAEKVLEYKVERVKPDWYPLEVLLFYWEGSPVISYSYDADACNALMYANGKDSAAGNAPPLPHYSSEDSEGAEWEVVNAMIERHDCDFRLCGFKTSYSGCGAEIAKGEPHREYEVEFKPRGYKGDERFIATAPTPQLAICRAALVAIQSTATPKDSQ